MQDVTLGNLYDVNKELMQKAPVLTDNEIADKKDLFLDFLLKNDNIYFMLLCKERADYTLFRISEEKYIFKVSNDIIECLQNRGKIQSIEQVDGAIEIWIKIHETKEWGSYNESFCYYFFPYDTGVIDYELEEEENIE